MLKSTQVLWFYLYKVLEQARLTYGEKKKIEKGCPWEQGYQEEIFWNDRKVPPPDGTDYVFGKIYGVVHLKFVHFTVHRF